MGGNGGNTSVGIFSKEPSTRLLLETSLPHDVFTIKEIEGRNTAANQSFMKEFDILIIDIAAGENSPGYEIISEITKSKLKNLKVILLVDSVPPEGQNRMENFGALCFLECFFTRQRLMQTLSEAASMKDTGCRIKGDDKFFNVSMFMNK